MVDLTPEEILKAEEMSLDELRALAGTTSTDAPTVAAQAEVLDNSADVTDDNQPAEQEIEVYRKTIENADGTIDVYEAESLEALVDKIADAKRAAVEQMKRVQAEKRELTARITTNLGDADYILGEKLKTNPRETIEEVTRRVIAEESARDQRSKDAQSRFVNTHPEYIAEPDNGARLTSEYRRLSPEANEFTSEGLEKAYQSLTRSGLLQLKRAEASGATETSDSETRMTSDSEPQVTQPRSPRRASTITMKRHGPAPIAPVQLTEDELYRMPLEDLRKLANQQLAAAE